MTLNETLEIQTKATQQKRNPTIQEIVELLAAADINLFGTKVSGFIKGSEVGQARCDRCVHYAHDACNHPVVMADPEVKKNEHGDAIVADEDCCNFWRPPTKKKK